MSKWDEVRAAIIGISAGIGLGIFGAELIEWLAGSRCPNCGSFVKRNEPYCNKCHSILRWQ